MADQVLELPCWPFALLLSSSLYFYHYPPGEALAEIPTVRFSRFLPDFINRLMFIFVAPYLIKYGYEKVLTCFSAHICHSHHSQLTGLAVQRPALPCPQSGRRLACFASKVSSGDSSLASIQAQRRRCAIRGMLRSF